MFLGNKRGVVLCLSYCQERMKERLLNDGKVMSDSLSLSCMFVSMLMLINQPG